LKKSAGEVLVHMPANETRQQTGDSRQQQVTNREVDLLLKKLAGEVYKLANKEHRASSRQIPDSKSVANREQTVTREGG
jgi:hypothetical protein